MECFGAGGSGSVGWVLINAVRAVPVTTTLLLCSGLAPVGPTAKSLHTPAPGQGQGSQAVV